MIHRLCKGFGALLLLGWRSGAETVIVDTESGKVEGRVSRPLLPFSGKVAVDEFFGIPFAAPPIGSNRFRPPQNFTTPWAPQVRSATSPLAFLDRVCIQFDLVSMLHLGQEDCLFLNVYRPHGMKPGAKLPVMVWFFGGAFILGDGYEFSMYDGTNIVGKHEYVIVTLNYRLSGLGFMALPELLEVEGTTGNYGMQDQRAALQWVQRNIGNFGGDPTQVTIAGESAGAFSVWWHLVSPASKGLFHAAIMQSGNSGADWFFQNRSETFEFMADWSKILGCDQAPGAARLSCLRSLPAHDFSLSIAQMFKDLLARGLKLPLPKDIPEFANPVWPVMPFGPVIDGAMEGLLDVPLRLVERGDFNKVPLMLGANKDGGAYFGPIFQWLWGEFLPDFEKFGEWMLPRKEDQQRLLELYDTPDFPTNRSKQDRAFRDVVFQCSDRAISRHWSKAGLAAHMYVFSFNFGDNVIEKQFGDAHAFELPFVWRNWEQIMGYLAHGEANYTNMADIMSCTWASFVQCQSPKCSQPPRECEAVLQRVPEWPVFSGDHNNYMSLRVDSVVEAIKDHTVWDQTDEFPGNDRCDFWDSAQLSFRHLRQSINTKLLQSAALAPKELLVV